MRFRHAIVLLLLISFLFAEDVPPGEEPGCSLCLKVDDFLEGRMLSTIDEQKLITETSFFYENFSQEDPRKPIINAPIFISVKDEDEKTLHVGFAGVTDSQGAIQFNFGSYDPEPGKCIEIKNIYCPTMCDHEFYGCLESFDVDPQSLKSNPELLKSINQYLLANKQDPNLVFPNTDPIVYCKPIDKSLLPAFCLPLGIIFALLAGALHLSGRNPFGGFDLSTPRMGKHLRYTARGRGAHVDLSAAAALIQKGTAEISGAEGSDVHALKQELVKRDSSGKVIMEPVLNKKGKPMLDKDKKPLMKPVMEKGVGRVLGAFGMLSLKRLAAPFSGLVQKEKKVNKETGKVEESSKLSFGGLLKGMVGVDDAKYSGPQASLNPAEARLGVARGRGAPFGLGAIGRVMSAGKDIDSAKARASGVSAERSKLTTFGKILDFTFMILEKTWLGMFLGRGSVIDLILKPLTGGGVYDWLVKRPFTKDIKETQAKVDSLKDSIDKARGRAQELEKNIKEGEGRLQELDKRLSPSGIEREVKAKEREIKDLESKLAKAKAPEEKQRIEQQITTLRAEAKSLNSQIPNLDSERENLKEKLAGMKKEYEQTRRDIIDHYTDIMREQAVLPALLMDKLSKDNQGINDSLKGLVDKKISATEKDLQQKETELVNTKDKDKREELENKIDSLRSRLVVLNEISEHGLGINHDYIADKIRSIQAEIQNKEGTLAKTKDPTKKEELKNKIDSLKSQLTAYSQMRRMNINFQYLEFVGLIKEDASKKNPGSLQEEAKTLLTLSTEKDAPIAKLEKQLEERQSKSVNAPKEEKQKLDTEIAALKSDIKDLKNQKADLEFSANLYKYISNQGVIGRLEQLNLDLKPDQFLIELPDGRKISNTYIKADGKETTLLLDSIEKSVMKDYGVSFEKTLGTRQEIVAASIAVLYAVDAQDALKRGELDSQPKVKDLLIIASELDNPHGQLVGYLDLKTAELQLMKTLENYNPSLNHAALVSAVNDARAFSALDTIFSSPAVNNLTKGDQQRFFGSLLEIARTEKDPEKFERVCYAINQGLGSLQSLATGANIDLYSKIGSVQLSQYRDSLIKLIENYDPRLSADSIDSYVKAANLAILSGNTNHLKTIIDGGNRLNETIAQLRAVAVDPVKEKEIASAVERYNLLSEVYSTAKPQDRDQASALLLLSPKSFNSFVDNYVKEFDDTKRKESNEEVYVALKFYQEDPSDEARKAALIKVLVTKAEDTTIDSFLKTKPETIAYYHVIDNLVRDIYTSVNKPEERQQLLALLKMPEKTLTQVVDGYLSAVEQSQQPVNPEVYRYMKLYQDGPSDQRLADLVRVISTKSDDPHVSSFVESAVSVDKGELDRFRTESSARMLILERYSGLQDEKDRIQMVGISSLPDNQLTKLMGAYVGKMEAADKPIDHEIYTAYVRYQDAVGVYKETKSEDARIRVDDIKLQLAEALATRAEDKDINSSFLKTRLDDYARDQADLLKIDPAKLSEEEQFKKLELPVLEKRLKSEITSSLFSAIVSDKLEDAAVLYTKVTQDPQLEQAMREYMNPETTMFMHTAPKFEKVKDQLTHYAGLQQIKDESEKTVLSNMLPSQLTQFAESYIKTHDSKPKTALAAKYAVKMPDGSEHIPDQYLTQKYETFKADPLNPTAKTELAEAIAKYGEDEDVAKLLEKFGKTKAAEGEDEKLRAEAQDQIKRQEEIAKRQESLLKTKPDELSEPDRLTKYEIPLLEIYSYDKTDAAANLIRKLIEMKPEEAEKEFEKISEADSTAKNSILLFLKAHPLPKIKEKLRKIVKIEE
ncbi:hypothetical protein HYT84_00015 [Candidatus Micrarchaeota archaeon]|nr:hypothetical protein [Candidatus Micrarchaeota archaeon]